MKALGRGPAVIGVPLCVIGVSLCVSLGCLCVSLGCSVYWYVIGVYMRVSLGCLCMCHWGVVRFYPLPSTLYPLPVEGRGRGQRVEGRGLHSLSIETHQHARGHTPRQRSTHNLRNPAVFCTTFSGPLSASSGPLPGASPSAGCP